MDFFNKYSWYIYGGIILIAMLIAIIHAAFLKLLEKRDYKKNYSTEKLRKKMRQRNDDNGNLYYGVYFRIWQKNKLQKLYNMFPIGEYFTNKLIVTDAVVYDTITDKIFGNGKRKAFYKTEFRVYYKVADVRKSIVNNFTHNGVGNQLNTVNQNEDNSKTVINQLENFLNEIEIESHDKTYIESFIYRMSQNQTTEKDKTKMIDTLSKYTSVGSDVASIIASVAQFFM